MARQWSALSLFAFQLFTAQAYADGIAIRPKVMHSQIQAEADSVRIGGFSSELNGQSDESLTGLGFAVDFGFKLDERTSFGSEVAVTNYEEDEAKASDMAIGGYFAYDFLSQNNMTFYGKGGLSLHQFAFEDFNSASLLNGDVAAGFSFALADNLDLGGEYRYSTTLGKGDMKSEDVDALEFKDLAIERNDLSAFLSFNF